MDDYPFPSAGDLRAARSRAAHERAVARGAPCYCEACLHAKRQAYIAQRQRENSAKLRWYSGT